MEETGVEVPMQTEQLLIPGRIKVGFNKRDDTYTGKLAYVIYFDAKGVLRKEKSWEGWRDKKIKPLEFDNVPTEGFVLNKKVGGGRSGWDHRQEYVRIYDPRDFEFEITVPNLLFILAECDCNRGKGLEGRFVYSWSGTQLVLLPVGSEDYKLSAGFTALQTKAVKIKEMTPGCSYLTKKEETLVYLGRFDYHHLGGYRTIAGKAQVEKRHVFWEPPSDDHKKGQFIFMNDLRQIGALDSDQVVSDLPWLIDRYRKSRHGSKIVKLFLKEGEQPKPGSYFDRYWAHEPTPGVFFACRNYSFVDKVVRSVLVDAKYEIENGELTFEQLGGDLTRDGRYNTRRQRCYDRMSFAPPPFPWVEPTNQCLHVELESGVKMKLEHYYFQKDNYDSQDR